MQNYASFILVKFCQGVTMISTAHFFSPYR